MRNITGIAKRVISSYKIQNKRNSSSCSRSPYLGKFIVQFFGLIIFSFCLLSDILSQPELYSRSRSTTYYATMKPFRVTRNSGNGKTQLGKRKRSSSGPPSYPCGSSIGPSKLHEPMKPVAESGEPDPNGCEIGNASEHQPTPTLVAATPKSQGTAKKCYQCRCGKGYRGTGNFKRHAVTHSGNRPTYECTTCGKIVLSQTSLARHKSHIHDGVRAFSCGLCPLVSQTKSNLVRHIISVHSTSRDIAKQFVIQIEDRPRPRPPAATPKRLSRRPIFVEKRAQATKLPCTSRSIALTPKRPQPKSGRSTGRKCSDCGMKFPSILLLGQHLAVHSDVRRFLCSLCVWRFKRLDTLCIHLQRMHAKSENEAREMTYAREITGAVVQHDYNMRERIYPDPAPIVSDFESDFEPFEDNTPTSSKIVKWTKPPTPPPAKPPVDHRQVIVIVGNLTFRTPRLSLTDCITAPAPKTQGCATYEQWFWKDYCKTIEERDCAPLIKTEPDFGMSLLEMTEMALKDFNI